MSDVVEQMQMQARADSLVSQFAPPVMAAAARTPVFQAMKQMMTGEAREMTVPMFAHVLASTTASIIANFSADPAAQKAITDCMVEALGREAKWVRPMTVGRTGEITLGDVQ